jgi:hypothetical protein
MPRLGLRVTEGRARLPAFADDSAFTKASVDKSASNLSRATSAPPETVNGIATAPDRNIRCKSRRRRPPTRMVWLALRNDTSVV